MANIDADMPEVYMLLDESEDKSLLTRVEDGTLAVYPLGNGRYGVGSTFGAPYDAIVDLNFWQIEG